MGDETVLISDDSACLAEEPSRDRDWLMPFAFLVPFVIYVKTLAPTVTLEDSGEFISVALHLGVAHPPGYPLWCLLAHLFTYLPIGSVAERVHLLSAACAAGATGFVYLSARRLTANRYASLLAACALGSSRIFWSQSVIAEVYTLNTFLLAMQIQAVLAFREDRRRRWLYWIALLQGLGIANHNLSLLFAPVFFIWILAIEGLRVFRPAVLLPTLALLLVGPALYLYIPWRAAQDPPVNWGNPRTLEEVIDHFTRLAYRSGGEEARASGGKLDVFGHVVDALAGSGKGFNWLLTTIAFLGALTFRKRERGFLLACLGMILLNTVVLSALMGEPFRPMYAFAHRVYYLPVHVLLALWLAGGIDWCLRIARDHGARATAVTAAVSFAGVLISGLWNIDGATSGHDQRARNFALDLMDSVPPGGGILPISDVVVFPCLYLRDVEGVRPDVKILSPHFGWRGEPVTTIFSPVPISGNMRRTFPMVANYISVPHRLGYLLLPPDAPVPSEWTAFDTLPQEPRDIGDPPNGYDPFDQSMRDMYSNYHARVGAKRMAEGKRPAAMEEFALAERYMQDPYSLYLLISIYGEFGMHEKRWRPLLIRALRHHRLTYDDAAARYHPVTRREIFELMEKLGIESRRKLRPEDWFE